LRKIQAQVIDPWFNAREWEAEMRFVVKISWDVEAGNALARQGKLASTVQSILAELKPEAAYFTAEGGQRGGILIVDVADVSEIPAIAEPWFLAANAKVEFLPAMRPEDLAKASPSIEAAVKKYA
jgi:Domain of unknown function (DUF3303)